MDSCFPFERLQAPFDVIVRLDEQLRTSPVARGFVARAHFRDACAALWRWGAFVIPKISPDFKNSADTPKGRRGAQKAHLNRGSVSDGE